MVYEYSKMKYVYVTDFPISQAWTGLIQENVVLVITKEEPSETSHTWPIIFDLFSASYCYRYRY